jgi:hypothetical protein
MTLREQVERVLPSWRRWYPSLFDAATDLGLLRAEVCSPDSLLLSKRHEKIQRAAEDAHRERWNAESEEPELPATGRGRYAGGRPPGPSAGARRPSPRGRGNAYVPATRGGGRGAPAPRVKR